MATRFALLMALLATCLFVVAGCGSSSDDKDKPAKTTQSDKADDAGDTDKADDADAKDKGGKTENEGPQFDDKQLEKLANGIYPVARTDAQRHHNTFPNTPPRMNALLNQVGVLAQRTITTHPKDARLQLRGVIGNWNTPQLLECSDEPMFVIISDKGGNSFAVFLTDKATATYLVYDYRQIGKSKDFNKDGFAVSSGTCAKHDASKKPLTPVAARVVDLA
jgi:hypothetical protein